MFKLDGTQETVSSKHKKSLERVQGSKRVETTSEPHVHCIRARCVCGVGWGWGGGGGTRSMAFHSANAQINMNSHDVVLVEGVPKAAFRLPGDTAGEETVLVV